MLFSTLEPHGFHGTLRCAELGGLAVGPLNGLPHPIFLFPRLWRFLRPHVEADGAAR